MRDEFKTDGGARDDMSRAYTLWFALPWLSFSAFFFVKFFYVTPPAWEILLSAVVFAAFLVAYFIAFRNYQRPGRLRRPAVFIILLGILMAPINPGANVFFSYPAWYLGRAFRPKQALLVIGTLAGLVVALTLIFRLDLDFFFPAFILTIGLGLMSIGIRRFEVIQGELALSREQVAHLARVAERERIARDLHDSVGHSLSVIALKSDVAAQLAGEDPVRAADEIAAVGEIARSSLAEIRATLSGYHELSLAAELDVLAASLRETGIQCDIEAETGELPAHVQTALTMCIRESVTNVIRHSGAGRCTVRIDADTESIRATIRDDGIGLQENPGNGLSGMRQRIEGMGGSIAIDGNRGTAVTVVLPVTLQ
jgi:two-component system sensor histidine kinase DesK